MKGKNRVVLFLGERVDHMGNIFQLFRDRNGEQFRYTKIKRPFFGDCYEIDKEEKMKTRPESVKGFEPTDKERLEYEAQKLCVVAERLSRKRAMKLRSPHPDIVRAIKLLRPFYRSMTRTDQNRFTQYLENELSKRSKNGKR